MTEETPEATAPGGAAEPADGAEHPAGPASETGQAGAAEPAPGTGDPRVDEALAALAGLGEVPDTEHVEAFEHVHLQLHQILNEVGDEQGSSARVPGPDGR